MTEKLMAPALMLVVMAGAMSAATISVLLRTPAEVAMAASSGDFRVLWYAVIGAFSDFVTLLLGYL